MMASITGSPPPKPRTGRNNHRQTKSSSSIAAPNQFNPKRHAQPSHNSQPSLNTTHIATATNYRGSNRPSSTVTPPTTPKAQHFPNVNAEAPGKKRKSKKQDNNKPKQEKTNPKGVTTRIQTGFPPEPIPADLESPPASSDEFPNGQISSGQITPPKMSSTPPSKAYAGPTFHHSPAPSALPKPKFFSKSVPGTPVGTSLQTMMESNVNSTIKAASPASAGQEKSQLELLFKAARAETMGMKRQGPGSTSTSSSDAATDSFSGAFGVNLDPESPIRSNRRVTRNIPHESLFFSMDEIDKPMSPMSPMSPTFKERTNHSCSVTTPSKVPTQPSPEEEKRRETANALKQYLLAPQSPVRKAPVSPPSPASRVQNRSQNQPPLPHFKVGPPLSLNRSAYQPQSPRSPAGTGYFPMFPLSPAPRPLEQQQRALYATPAHAATPPRGPPVSYKPLSPVDNMSAYMAPQQFSGSPLYHNNSILASKLEAVTGPVIQQSVTDLENDLRRVLMI